MSRRAIKQQEKAEFLQKNPTLIEYNTRIAPTKNDNDLYVLEVTQDGNEPSQSEATEIAIVPGGWFPRIEGDAIPDLITVQDEVETAGAELDANFNFGRRSNDASVAISELGIGVTSGGDLVNLGIEIIKGDLGPEDLVRFATISDNERLEVEVDDEAPEGAITPDQEMFPFLELSGREVGIGFDIISGSGQIEITLTNSATGETSTLTFDTSVASFVGRRATQIEIDHITAALSDGEQFDGVEISTTGDLEITVTGIDLVSGYNYGEVVPS